MTRFAMYTVKAIPVNFAYAIENITIEVIFLNLPKPLVF